MRHRSCFLLCFFAITFLLTVLSFTAPHPLQAQGSPTPTPADLHIHKTSAPDPVTAGQPLTYTIVVTNTGPAIAQNVIIRDVLPPGVAFNGAWHMRLWEGMGGNVELNGNTLTGTVGTLNIGGIVTITVQTVVDTNTSGSAIVNTASVSSTTSLLAGNHTASVTTNVVTATPPPTPSPTPNAADLSITKRTDPSSVMAGQPVTYTIVVTNAGPSTAQHVIIKDLLPTGVKFSGASGINTKNGANSNLSLTSSALTGTVGTLQVGGVITITGRALVNVNATGAALVNTASVTTTNDLTPTNNTASAITNLITPTPTLTATPTNSPTNTATATAPDMPTATGTATPTAINLPLPTDTPVATATNTATPVPTRTETTTAVPTNTPTASNTPTFTATPTNPPALTPTKVSNVADLRISKWASANPVKAGDPLLYTIVITNTGPSAARNVVIQDQLPDGVGLAGNTIIRAQNGVVGNLIVSNNALTGTVVTLNAGGVVTITAQTAVRIDAIGNTLKNTASVTTTNDSVPGNNTASVVTGLIAATPTSTPTATATATQTPTPPPPTATSTPTNTPTPAQANLQISIRSDPKEISAGQPLTYTILVTNTGGKPANNLVVKDTLPPGVTPEGQTRFHMQNGTEGDLRVDSGVVTASAATLEPSGTIWVTIPVRVNSNLTEPELLNRVRVDADGDSLPLNSTASTITPLVTPPKTSNTVFLPVVTR